MRSQICDRYGIFAASRALRHADIAITSQHYLDKKQRTSIGLGNPLSASAVTQQTAEDGSSLVE
jgi:hypothetical protein